MDRDRVNALLDTIDGALHDDNISDDAMKWTPEGDRIEGDRVLDLPLEFTDCELHFGSTPGWTIVDETHLMPRVDLSQIRPVTVELAANIDPFRLTMENLSRRFYAHTWLNGLTAAALRADTAIMEFGSVLLSMAPPPPKRAELARRRRIASAMHTRDRRAARRLRRG